MIAEILKEKQKEYGDAKIVHHVIAQLWKVYIDNVDLNHIRATDVYMLKILDKIGRLIVNIKHEDSKIDIIGYVTLLQEFLHPVRKDCIIPNIPADKEKEII